MLTFLCTAPSSTTTSPVDGSFPSSRAPPPDSDGSSSYAGPSSSPTSNRKLGLLSNPVRRPSFRKRIQSISRVSGASIDKATATLSNAAGSSFSFFRHGSSGSSSSSSAGNVSASGSGSASSSAHTRGASISSFASGRSSRSKKSSSSSGHGHGRGDRLNVLNIGAPSAFKHQFHLGPDPRISDGPWDETGWCHVDTRGNVHDDTLVIDVVPPTAARVSCDLPCASTSSEHHVSHSRSPSRSERTGASISSPNLLSIATCVATTALSPSTSTSPATTSTSTATPTSSADVPADEAPAKTSRQAKRASLVKRKPVPPLYPEDVEPLPTSTTASPLSSPAPAQTTYVLMPDPSPSETQMQVKEPETAPAGKTSFEVHKFEDTITKEPTPVVPAEKPNDRKPETGEIKAEAAKEPTPASAPAPFPPSLPIAPAHICILHSSPAPTLPPRRHTLAHMQARALGRGLGDMSGPSLPSVPKLPQAVSVSVSAPASSETQEKEKKKAKARPMPIVAPSHGTVESAASSPAPMVPPGLTTGEEDKITDEKTNAAADEERLPSTTPLILADNSPRPSLSSLMSSSTSSNSSTAHGLSSRSSSESCELDSEMEPRTPTDERRVSAGSAASIQHKSKNSNMRRKGVRIVLPGDFPVDDDEFQEREVETPRVLRRASKRPNPPVRRVENEESVYVTADEADDV